MPFADAFPEDFVAQVGEPRSRFRQVRDFHTDVQIVQHAGDMRGAVRAFVLKDPKVMVAVAEIEAVVEFVDYFQSERVAPKT